MGLLHPQQTPSPRPGRHSFTGHSSHNVGRDLLPSHLDSTLAHGGPSNLLQPLVLTLLPLDQILGLGQTPLVLVQTLLDSEQTPLALDQIPVVLGPVLLALG